jgi:hypothetical protein
MPSCRRRADISGGRWAERPPELGRRLRRSGLGNQLVSRFELADVLLRCVAGAFHGGVPGPVWPEEHSHSSWTDFWGTRLHVQQRIERKA